ncbi:MAG: hypothetical protein RLZ04_767, partial [Actinomycetota bacterium]
MPPIDEMLTDGAPRPAVAALWESITRIGAEGLQQRGVQRDQYLSVQGITFTLAGHERPLPIDLVPRVIEAAEWTTVETGIKQRVRALEAFLDDVYGSQSVFRDGVVPRSLVTSSEHFHRAVHGIVPPNGVRIHVAGIDLV